MLRTVLAHSQFVVCLNEFGDHVIVDTKIKSKSQAKSIQQRTQSTNEKSIEIVMRSILSN